MRTYTAEDGTIKISYDEGYSAVIIPQVNDKRTVCLSTQVGCPMGCGFCLSGKKGFKRNLTSKEMVEQFTDALNELDATRSVRELITAVVFMGMGEPMLNVDEVMEACEYLHVHYQYSYKRISISTSGIIPGMEKIMLWRNKVHLALSLHYPFQDIRNKLLPALKKYPITDLIDFCHKYNKKRKENIMIEYLMIDGFTDRDEDLQALIDFGLEPLTNFNLIPLNGTCVINEKEYSRSSLDRCKEFKQKLMDAGYKCFIRDSRGVDIEAACGMLGFD